MLPYLRIGHRRTFSGSMLLVVMLVLSACSVPPAGETQPATPTEGCATGSCHSTPTPPQPAAWVLTRSAASETLAGISGTLTTTITAACPAGQQVVSGGYALSPAIATPQTLVIASYPSQNAAWSVTFGVLYAIEPIKGPITATVYANCVADPAGLLSIQEALTQQIKIRPDLVQNYAASTCPQANELSGAGYQFLAIDTAHGGEVYALRAICITRGANIVPGATIRQVLTPGVFTSLTVACPAGTRLIGGGITREDPLISISADTASADGSQWQVTAFLGSDASTTFSYAVALTPLCAGVSA